MSWPVYSKRFLHTSVRDAWVFYTVPQNKVAVVTMVAAFSAGTAGDYCQAQVAGIHLFFVPFQVGERYRSSAVRWVAYGGEQIGIFQHGTQQYAHVTGYLFDDKPTAATKPVEPSGPPQVVPVDESPPAPLV